MIHILDDLVPQSLEKGVEEILVGDNFEWYFNKSTDYSKESPYIRTYVCESKNIKDSHQFTHTVVRDANVSSTHYPMCRSILYFVEKQLGFEVEFIHRIKCNLNTADPTWETNDITGPHIDMEDDGFVTALYYANESDGNTVLFDQTWADNQINLTVQQEVEPKKNRCVVFKSNQLHAASKPRHSSQRAVINFIFKVAQ